MQFDVTVQRTEHREHTFRVEADTENESITAGLEAACDYDFRNSPVSSADEDVIATVRVLPTETAISRQKELDRPASDSADSRDNDQWVVDECANAKGFSTIRRRDGSDNGDIDSAPIATVYNQHDAVRIVECVNACKGIANPAALPSLLKACMDLIKHLESLPTDNEKCRILKMALNNRSGELIREAIDLVNRP